MQLTATATRLEDVLSAVTTLVSEARLRFDGSNNLTICAVDPANVGMVDVAMPAEAFESFENEDNTEVIGVDLTELQNAVSAIEGQPRENSNEKITVSVTYTDDNRLEIEGGNMSFTIPTQTPESIREEPDIPNLMTSAQVSMIPSAFKKYMTVAKQQGDHLSFEVTPDENFHLSTKDDLSDFDVTLENDNYPLTSVLNTSGDTGSMMSVTSMYSLDYLTDLAKGLNEGDDVEIMFGDSLPMMLSTSLCDGTVNLEYILAPRIPEESSTESANNTAENTTSEDAETETEEEAETVEPTN